MLRCSTYEKFYKYLFWMIQVSLTSVLLLSETTVTGGKRGEVCCLSAFRASSVASGEWTAPVITGKSPVVGGGTADGIELKNGETLKTIGTVFCLSENTQGRTCHTLCFPTKSTFKLWVVFITWRITLQGSRVSSFYPETLGGVQSLTLAFVEDAKAARQAAS